MKRREFIGLIGGAAAWPVTARAQQKLLVGYLGGPAHDAARTASFRQGLAERGYREGENLTIVSLWAEGRLDRLPALAADLAHRGVRVIFAEGNYAALAVKAAGLAIPFVFAVGDDPVSLGLVSSLNKPAVNGTGVTFYRAALVGKRLELLHPMVAAEASIAVLVNPAGRDVQAHLNEAATAARTLARRIVPLEAGTTDELDRAFERIMAIGAGGFFHVPDPFYNAQRHRLCAFAARAKLPAIYPGHEYIEAGGLMAYGSSLLDAFRQAGAYVGRILAGERAADLPVEQPTKFELALNLKTARALGLEFPSTLLALADEVIE